MKFSENWFREWTNPNLTVDELAEELSLAGLEIDDVAPVAPAFSKVVVGHVLSVEKHPDADKLNVTQVDVGESEPVQIVCGAKNVVVGMKACCAMVGAVLPGDFKIKKAKLRGVPSHGMLCGASEIGVDANGVDGLHVLPADAPIGLDIREYLDLNDHVIDVDLTPNRADCLSIEGMARDAAAMSNIAWTQPYDDVIVEKQGDCGIVVDVQKSAACPKYLGCTVTGYNVNALTPDWIKQRLERGGLASKNLIVDITNYVLLELGQPMHAFDVDKLSGSLSVRFATEGESLLTLDDKTLTLKTTGLVIADDKGPVALAGIMGGMTTAVSNTTTRVFFECAHFSRLAITGKARAYGLHTDSSHRFERGVDPLLPERALERALHLFTQVAGGTVSTVASSVSESDLPKANTIQLRPERVVKLLGVAISSEQIESIFKRLGFCVVANDDGWVMTAPSYRFDMEIEADLIEEVGRIYGYNNLPDIEVVAPMRLPKIPESQQELHTLKLALVQRGYQEVITYSFVEEDKQKALFPELPYICLKNPISDDMKAMRTSLFSGLLNSISYNQNRQQGRLKLFESGLTFLNKTGEMSGLEQVLTLSGAIVGTKSPAGWSVSDPRNLDFFDLKGDVETLFSMSHLTGRVSFEPLSISVFHPGQSAAILLDGQVIGKIGQLHPSHTKLMDVSGKVFLFELIVAPLSFMAVPSAKKISKFPEVQRDLAFVVDVNLPVQSLLNAAMAVSSDILKSVDLFDIYTGKGIEDTEKSIAINLRIQHVDRTLQDEEVEELIANVIDNAEKMVSARLR